jgi:hypothetical protein
MSTVGSGYVGLRPLSHGSGVRESSRTRRSKDLTPERRPPPGACPAARLPPRRPHHGPLLPVSACKPNLGPPLSILSSSSTENRIEVSHRSPRRRPRGLGDEESTALMAAVTQKDEWDARVVLVAIHNGGCSSAMAVVVVNFLLDEIPLPSPVYSTDWYTHAFAFFCR